MNLTQLRSAVSHEIGLDNNASTEQPDIDTWLNEGVIRVLEDTQCYVTETQFSGFDGSSTDYTLDSGILEVADMYLISGTVNYRLERESVDELIERKRMSTPVGEPTSYFAINGENMIQLWPAPGTGDNLLVYYTPVPTALSATADDPSNTQFGGVPSYFHLAIIYWACSRAGSYDDDASSAQGQRYIQLYQEEIARARKHMRKRGGNRNARAIPNDVKRRRAFHDNSTYPAYSA